MLLLTELTEEEKCRLTTLRTMPWPTQTILQWMD